MSPEIIKENLTEQEKTWEQYPLSIEVFKNTESATMAVAKKLAERIAQANEEELKIGISHGDTLNQVIDNFVAQIKEKIEKGDKIDLSKIQFIQMEALFPESKDSAVNKFAHTLEIRLVKPLEQLGLNVNIYYPGESEKSFKETLAEYRKLVSAMDIDIVSVNTSGDARAFRDANYNPETGEAEYVLGSFKHRGIAVRPFSETAYDPQKTNLGGKIFIRPKGDIPSEVLFRRLQDNIDGAFATGDTVTKKSQYLLTEGLRIYKNAKEVWIAATGDIKRTAVSRMFENIRIDGMPLEEKSERRKSSKANKEGKTSAAALIETRGGRNTWVVLDKAAVGDYNFSIDRFGAKIKVHS